MKWGNLCEQTIRRSRNRSRGCWIDYSFGQIGCFRFYRSRFLAAVHSDSRGAAARALFWPHGSVHRLGTRRGLDRRIGYPVDRQLVRLGADEVVMAVISFRDRRRII
jgi:hypothetical protein